MFNCRSFISACLISLFLFTSHVSAYVVRVTNGTNEAIAFDINGVAVWGGSMMQGKIHHLFKKDKKIWDIIPAKSTTYYKNAGAIPPHKFSPIRKPILKPGHTAVLKFTDIDFGVCFDFSNIAIGLKSKGYSMRAREVKFADSAAFEEVMDAVESMGPGIGMIGEGVTEVDNPKVKAVGAVLQGVGALWGKVATAAKGTGCRSISMIIVKTDINTTTQNSLKIGSKLGVFVLR